MPISRIVVLIFSVGMMVPRAAGVSAQDYPNKPIRIVAPAAGGGSDFGARLIVPALAVPLGQPVIIDNRGGSILASEVAAKAPPDGYTLLVNGNSLWAVPLLQKAPYDAVKDFSPISLISREVFVATVHPSLPVKTVKELIALAKARPGELNYASAGVGSTGHLGGELFKSMAGVKITWVPYKGTAPATTALVSGEVQLAIANATAAAPHIKSGRLRALAVTSAEPSALVPGLPTVAASGLPGYEVVTMTGIWAPARTPGVIINRLSHEISRFLNLQDVKERSLNAGVEAAGSTPEQFAAIIRADITRMDKTIKEAGIKLD